MADSHSETVKSYHLVVKFPCWIETTHSSCFSSGCSQTAVSNIMALEGSSIIIKLLKVDHLLDLGPQKTVLKKKNFFLRALLLQVWSTDQPTNQVFISFALKGELPPSNKSNLREDIMLQQLLKQQLASFP